MTHGRHDGPHFTHRISFDMKHYPYNNIGNNYNRKNNNGPMINVVKCLVEIRK